jgi:LmbE family N-acetylglucosaminyl deacetylase
MHVKTRALGQLKGKHADMNSVLAIAAHPDDIEFLMAGTLMALGDAGYSIHYLNIANGCCGTTEYDAATIATIRRSEALSAATMIGATFHESICNDLEIFYDKPTLAKVASIIRLARPNIVLTHAPLDYMEDHTNACRLAVTAAFSRAMPNFEVDPPREVFSESLTVYHAQPYSHFDPLRRFVDPDVWVDVSDKLEQKLAMLAKHESQKKWLDQSQGLDSYLRTLRDLDAAAGRASGKFQYAEGWRRHSHLGFCGPHDDPLAEALGPRIAPAKGRGNA